LKVLYVHIIIVCRKSDLSQPIIWSAFILAGPPWHDYKSMLTLLFLWMCPEIRINFFDNPLSPSLIRIFFIGMLSYNMRDFYPFVLFIFQYSYGLIKTPMFHPVIKKIFYFQH